MLEKQRDSKVKQAFNVLIMEGAMDKTNMTTKISLLKFFFFRSDITQVGKLGKEIAKKVDREVPNLFLSPE